MTRTVARLLAESLEAHDVDQIYLRARRELCRADQRADRAQLDPRRRLPARGRRRLHGGGRRPAARPRRRRDRLARTRPVERDGVAAFGLSRRDADGDAGRPGRAQGFRPPGAAGAELLAAAVRRHQAGHRGQRAGAGLGGDRPRLPPRRERHAGPGRGDPARGHLRRGDRRRDSTSRARVSSPGRAPRISTGWPTCWRRPSGRWSWSAARCWPMRCATRRRSPTCNRLAEEWVLPICPTHRRPQLFDATHPNYGGYMGIRVPPALIGEMKKADLMVALGERMTDTVSQSYTLPAGAAAATAVGACLAGRERGRPRLAARSRHRRASPHEVIKALLQRGAPADAGEAPRLGRRAATRSTASCWRRNGSRPRTASISPRSSARSTSTWRRTRR